MPKLEPEEQPEGGATEKRAEPWDPFAKLQASKGRSVAVVSHTHARFEAQGYQPPAEIVEARETITLRLNLSAIAPVDPKDIDIRVEGLVLSVRGKRSGESDQATFPSLQPDFSTFEYSLLLPERVNSENISADYENNVLTIQVLRPAGASRPGIELPSETEPAAARGKAEKSAAVMEYAEVLAHAVDTFGSRTRANAWLNRPNRVFNNQSPLQILTQDPAAVEEELVRIDHGMFL